VFVILLHPTDYEDIAPFLPNIRMEILQELKTIVADRNYLLAGNLSLTIKTDKNGEEGRPLLKGRMSGSDEPDSVIEYEQHENRAAKPLSGQSDPSTQNIAAADALRYDPLTTLEEGITILRDGNPGQAIEVLSELSEDAGDIPQYHAVMGVCRKMLGQDEEARVHFDQLQEMQPEVSSALLLSHDDFSANKEKNIQKKQKKSAGYRLETNIAGVSLVTWDKKLILENRYLDPTASVDSKVEESIVIESGDVVTLGTVRLHVTTDNPTNEVSK
jgi:tetratricopeptide (TPR) repeat protein